MKRWTVLLVTVLLIFSLSCSFLGGGEDVDVEELVPEIEELVPEEVETDEAAEEDVTGAPEFDADALQGLDSYRSRFTMRTEFEDGEVQEVSFEQEATRNPEAQRILMQNAMGEASEEIEMISVGDTQWMRVGEEWIQTVATDDDSAFDQGLVYSADDFTSAAGDDDYEYVGKEKVNGVQTRHYRLKLGAFSLPMLADEDLDSASADVWVADESDLPEFPVRFILEVEGELEEGRPGTYFFNQEVYDVNADFVIEPPADAATGGLPSDIPVYPDASELTSMGGMTIFSSADDTATVAAFYRDALESAGWSQGETSEFEGLVMETWTKEDQTLNLTITTKDEGGTDVMIIVE